GGGGKDTQAASAASDGLNTLADAANTAAAAVQMLGAKSDEAHAGDEHLISNADLGLQQKGGAWRGGLIRAYAKGGRVRIPGFADGGGLMDTIWNAGKKFVTGQLNAAMLPGQVASGQLNVQPSVPGQWSDEDEARLQLTNANIGPKPRPCRY